MRYGSAVRHASLGSPRVLGLLASHRTCAGHGDAPRRGFCVLRLMGRIAWALGELSFGRGPSLASLSRTRDREVLSLDPPSENLQIRHHLPQTTPVALPEQVRSVMRLLPNSVVVCTSAQGDIPRGMTMSSFNSLSLSPTPVISFNVATPSRTLDAIRATRVFHVHIMSGDARGMAVADRFTRGNTEDVFRGVAYTTTGPGGIPLLEGEGVLYALRCRLLPDEPTGGLVRVRDHVIVLGEVLGVMAGSGTGDFGLAYANRQYRHVGRRRPG